MDMAFHRTKDQSVDSENIKIIDLDAIQTVRVARIADTLNLEIEWCKAGPGKSGIRDSKSLDPFAHSEFGELLHSLSAMQFRASFDSVMG